MTPMHIQQPLKWPEGWERTPLGQRKPNASWKRTLNQYVTLLEKEAKRAGATETLLTYNEPDGARLDPGVALYFSRQPQENFDWQLALGIANPAPTLGEIDEAFKRLAMRHHPDRGGDAEVYLKLKDHREHAIAWVKGTHRQEHEYSIGCDRFNDIRLNVAGLARALMAIRMLDRVGVPGLLERSFRGFRVALPMPPAPSAAKEKADVHS